MTPADTSEPDRAPETIPFSDLARASYCPRQLYYARRTDRSVPDEVRERMRLAFRYDELRTASLDTLRDAPIDPSITEYRDRLSALAARSDWDGLTDPEETRAFLQGKDCHGTAHKLVAGDPPTPTIVSPGAPPPDGVWEPQTVRAVAAAKALSWEREREIPTALVEYPTHGIVRSVPIDVRRAADYRRALRTVRAIDGPPPKLHDSDKCEPCPHRESCGVETRSLRSRLGL